MSWFLWSVLLILQNFTQTLSSRAKNSDHLSFHAVASAMSNGIWFVSQFILVDKMTKVLATGNYRQIIPLALFYMLFTMSGALGSQWLCIRYLDRWLTRTR